MFGFEEAKDKRDKIYGQHGGRFSHEAVAGGVAFEAMKKWEDGQRRKGKPVHHSLAKELLMGVTGAEMDKFAESKGMDFASKEEAKNKAREQAEALYDQQYGDMDNYDPEQMDRHSSMDY